MFEHVKYPQFLAPTWKPMDGKHYCGRCIDTDINGYGWHSKASVTAHVYQDHDVHPDAQEDGFDVLTSDEAYLALRRWHSHLRDTIEQVVPKFRRALDSMVGPDDFITDCG